MTKLIPTPAPSVLQFGAHCQNRGTQIRLTLFVKWYFSGNKESRPMSRMLEIGQRIHAQNCWLGKPLIELADRALTEFDAEKHQDVVTKVAFCLEGTLKKLLESWEVPYGRATFGELIGKLRETERVPKSLLDRLSEANCVRNRLVHNQQPDEHDRINEGDALLILNILDLTVAWCARQVAIPVAPQPADLRIFLSVGGEHRLDQLQFLQHLYGELRNLRVEIQNLSSGEYSEQRPFDQIREIMGECRGALVVGLERSHAYAVVEREQSKKQKLYPDQYAPTAWNQIEGAMASALQLPILILKDRRLRDEGIFEVKNHRHRREEFDLGEEANGLSRDVRDILTSWLQHVRTSARSVTPGKS